MGDVAYSFLVEHKSVQHNVVIFKKSFLCENKRALRAV